MDVSTSPMRQHTSTVPDLESWMGWRSWRTSSIRKYSTSNFRPGLTSLFKSAFPRFPVPAFPLVILPVLLLDAPVRKSHGLDGDVAHRRGLRGAVPVPDPAGDHRDLSCA